MDERWSVSFSIMTGDEEETEERLSLVSSHGSIVWWGLMERKNDLSGSTEEASSR
jgi:hypothetical protein